MRILEEVDELHDLDLGLLASGHVPEGNLDLLGVDQLGGRLAHASKQATTDTDRSSSMSAGISSLFGLEQTAEKNNITPSSLVEANFDNEFSGGGKTTRSENLVATLTTQVIEVYPNGNLKIRGGKSVTVNNEKQIIYLTGIVRPYDVSADNTVDSGNILYAQITYTGKGSISDKQKPGWLMRILDNTWPF